jgi:hypothetical protein
MYATLHVTLCNVLYGYRERVSGAPAAYCLAFAARRDWAYDLERLVTTASSAEFETDHRDGVGSGWDQRFAAHVFAAAE